MKHYFRGVIWPRQSKTVEPLQGPKGPVYRYAVVGMLVCDEPLKSLDGDCYVLDGCAHGLPEALEMAPKILTKSSQLGSVDNVLTNLEFLPVFVDGDQYAASSMAITCLKKDLRTLHGFLGRRQDWVIDEGNEWVSIEYWPADYGMFEERHKASGKGIPWFGGTRIKGDLKNVFACDGKTQIECDSDMVAAEFDKLLSTVITQVMGTDAPKDKYDAVGISV